MNFDPDPSDLSFRAKVRSFLEDNWIKPHADRRAYPLGREAFALAAKILEPKRWLAPNWPVEWGGCELSPMQRYVLEDELAAARFPPSDRIALDLAGPVIYTFGSPEQKKRYLPRILAGEEVWCQGFSEPESGSDVNSLRTSATRDGNYYIVEGRKLWTSNAHFSDMMFALVRVRSEGKLQHGLTFLLIGMHDPRVSVRPIVTIDGRHHVNEVSLDSVRVPVTNVVGEIGRGWRNARFLLANERLLLSNAPRTRQGLSHVKRLAALRQRNGRSLRDDPSFQRRLAQVEIDLLALEAAILRVLYASQNDPVVSGLTCVLKLRGAELRQRICELGLEALGDRGLIDYSHQDVTGDTPPGPEYASAVTKEFLFSLSATISGGTSEIQRNLIAGVSLGL